MKISRNFRGLLYAPNTESELGILFGLLLPYLRPPMCVVEGEFQVSDRSWPDLKVKILEDKRWKSCRIEFEVKSATFIQHRHNPSDYDKIVCWEDNWHILSEKDKKKYRKFCNPGNRISIKKFLEKNKLLDTKDFILYPTISSKSIYRNAFAILRRGLDGFEELKKHIARDYISYFKDNISFVQFKAREKGNVDVYISGKAIRSLRDPLQFTRDITIFGPKTTKQQEDLSFSINSLQDANAFIAVLGKYLRK